MSNWLGFDRGISQAISDWAQLSDVLTDCWWRQRQRERERLEDKARENCKGKKNQLTQNLFLIHGYPFGIWLACILIPWYFAFGVMYLNTVSLTSTQTGDLMVGLTSLQTIKAIVLVESKALGFFLLNNDLKSHYRVFKTFLILLRDENE